MDTTQTAESRVVPPATNGTEPPETWVRLEGEEDTTPRPHPDPAYLRKIKEDLFSLEPPGRVMRDNASQGAMVRTAQIRRDTAETKIKLELDLDGTGKSTLATGIGFFDHMLTLLAKHSLIDLTVEAKGDLHVDAHHTVEDVGICFGKALVQALGDKANIRRYGDATLPMDEVLVTAAIDLSGRPFCIWRADILPEMLGTFNAPLAEEFWRAVSGAGLMNLHVVCHHGKNSHHIVEGIFKACARALRQAVEFDPRAPGVPSTKGVL
jgi:imidazoleglycerol-phosphate dehydratase